VTGAGRTDAGVHALGQVVSFTGHDTFPVEKLAVALNSALPPDLSARDAARTAAKFSARLSALERHYVYVVLNRREPSAVMRRYAHFEHRELDRGRMRRAAQHLVGTHDFASFCGVLPDRGGTERTVRALEIERRGDLVLLHARANGFLHRMVRIMVGTLLEIGSGRRAEDSLPEILAARDRRAAGLTAPPQGLFLTGVRYADFTSERPLDPLRSGDSATGS
jgi:tRNA pseudouridine38-40 synthase